ncbi:MAG: hypothetical protein AAGK02_17150 [Pseudomonadota bacterium]
MSQPRIPPFHAVPLRARSDGWTPLRQAEFIGHLAETRSVAKAARAVGMARETAYRLRTRPFSESFCAAWDAALGRPLDSALLASPSALIQPNRKVTLPALAWRIESGVWSVILRRGKYAGVRQKPDNSAVLAAASRLGLLSRTPLHRADHSGPGLFSKPGIGVASDGISPSQPNGQTVAIQSRASSTVRPNKQRNPNPANMYNQDQVKWRSCSSGERMADYAAAHRTTHHVGECSCRG